ncbi:MAG: RnfABCDGE type electron transport complex subunit D [Bacteroidaceae bacterium]|nr:RnfABCDGE type electron transport complex subunit D [Bacteroidaceae bacterium]
MNKLTLSLSPHVHSGDSVSKNMRWVIIAMLPAMLWSFYTFGLGAVIVTAVSVASCVFFEWVINKYILKNDKCTVCDLSAVVTGILLAFNLPSNLPLYIIIVGALFAIGVVKMTFGGLGCNLFNPALAARVFLLISFPVKMTVFPEVGQMTAYADAVTAATPMSNLAQSNLWDLFLGNVGGSLGEVSALCLLIGLVVLLVSRTITWHIPVSILVTVFALTGLLHIAYPVEVATPWHHLCGGGLMLGAIFMATDYVTSPMTPKGQLIYGFCIGFLTVAIRVFGAYPEGMSFAILIMNAFVPLINNACKPKRFAKEVKK